MNNHTIPLKRCTKCGNEYPATLDYFHKHKHQKSGLRPDCKTCCRGYKLANKEHAKQVFQDRYQRNKEKHSERYRAWRLKNSSYDRARHQAHYLRNRAKENADSRAWRAQNPARVALLNREYRQRNRERFRVYSHQHRARKRALPHSFSAREWERCLDYWNRQCAVCCNVLVKTHGDHWIPLNYRGADNPGTVATNMLCLCDTCNLSKNDTLPEVWLRRQWGEEAADKILTRIFAYFEWVRQQV